MYGDRLLYDFTNAGRAQGARRFPGLPPASEVTRIALAPRAARRIELDAGDLLSIEGGRCLCLAWDAHGRDGSEVLGLAASVPLDLSAFSTGELIGWATARGVSDLSGRKAAQMDGTDEPMVVRVLAPVTAWMISEAAGAAFVEGQVPGPLTIAVTSASRTAPRLPEPLGPVHEEFTISRGTARAYTLDAGDIVQIIDIEGQQCSDFTAFRSHALDAGKERMIDSTATRSMVRRSYPAPGLFDKFFDQDMRPMMQVVQDTCGVHDAFGLACTARGYEERGFPGHLNCSDNISHALDRFSINRRAAWPAINFFWRTWIDPQTHQILTEESHSRPGDYVALRALEPLVCVSTACPDDIDPINGWNPTDVHVRIYRNGGPIRRAVAYREKEDAPMSLSHPSAFHVRTEALTPHFAPARDMWVPTSYPATGVTGEYWACREKVTVQDMSGLRKFDIVGPDAEAVLQQALTRDVARLPVWRGTYALMCDDSGTVIDDGTLFRLGPELFRWCCGSEESGRVLQETARRMGAQIRIHGLGNRLPSLAVQGPHARALLDKIAFTQPHVPGLAHLKWFGVTVARLRDRDGAPFMLARTGYTGELGYELFCTEDDAVQIWDSVMEAGEAFGIVPMGNDALNILRTEAGFAAAGAEFAPDVDAFEAGLGFAVDLRKADFTGRAALARNAQAPRKLLKGLLFDVYDLPAHGALVMAKDRPVGVVTSAVRSPGLGRAIAMARIAVEHAEDGTTLDVGMMDGRMKRLSATVCAVPFVDPTRSKARA